MKRKEEVDILTSSLLKSGLIEERKSDRVRFVLKEALKEIRRRRHKQKTARSRIPNS